MFFIIQLMIFVIIISTTNGLEIQDRCRLEAVRARNVNTVEVFKDRYLGNFKEKHERPYDLSNNYEMETRFHFKIPCGTMEYDPAAAIVGGDNAPDKAWPWQVRVYNDAITCGGVLIDADWVLTAAHCVKENTQYTIRLGTRFRTFNIDQFVRTSKQVIVHEDYEGRTSIADIALIKISSPVNFTDRVRPACLPVYRQEFFNNDQCYITGFGQRNPGVVVSHLQQLKVYVVPQKECFYILNAGTKHYIDWRFICVGRVRQRGGACDGDSGSPLSCKIGNRYYVGGLTSFVYGDCKHDYIPDGYTRVASFINWIFHTMSKNK